MASRSHPVVSQFPPSTDGGYFSKVRRVPRILLLAFKYVGPHSNNFTIIKYASILNSRDRQGNLWVLQRICLQNNFTTIFPSKYCCKSYWYDAN